MNYHSKHLLITCLIAFALILPVQEVFAHAGKVLFASGTVNVISNRHKDTELKRGSKVWPGDTVITAKDASIQIRAGDGSLISLKENSKLIIAHR